MKPAIETKSAGVAALPVRAVGRFIDGVLIGSVAQVIAHFVHPRWVGTAIGVALICLYTVPQIADPWHDARFALRGVQVTDDKGNPPGWKRSLIRWGTPAVIAPVVVVVIPGGPIRRLVGVAVLLTVLFLPALVDSRRRTLQDRAAGTIVYYRHRGAGPL